MVRHEETHEKLEDVEHKVDDLKQVITDGYSMEKSLPGESKNQSLKRLRDGRNTLNDYIKHLQEEKSQEKHELALTRKAEIENKALKRKAEIENKSSKIAKQDIKCDTCGKNYKTQQGLQKHVRKTPLLSPKAVPVNEAVGYVEEYNTVDNTLDFEEHNETNSPPADNVIDFAKIYDSEK